MANDRVATLKIYDFRIGDSIAEKLHDIIENLLARDYEEDWFEFKENWFEHHTLGEYISSMSNAAAMVGQRYAYFVWGLTTRLIKLPVQHLTITATSGTRRLNTILPAK